MNSTKIISLRVPMDTYEDILIECDTNGSNVSDWIFTKITRAKKSKLVKSQLLEKLEQLYETAEKYPTLLNGRINRLIRFVKEEL
jgi:hypothetical protein